MLPCNSILKPGVSSPLFIHPTILVAKNALRDGESVLLIWKLSSLLRSAVLADKLPAHAVDKPLGCLDMNGRNQGIQPIQIRSEIPGRKTVD